MLRVPTLLLLVVLALPYAHAGPVLADVAVGPGGPASPGEPYYLGATASVPEAPAAADAKDDCAAARRPAGLERVAMLVEAIRAWNPVREVRLSGWFPTCLAVAIAPCDATMPVCPGDGRPLYVSYDTGSGRYYAEVPVPAALDGTSAGDLIDVLPFSAQQAESVAVSGTTGVGMRTDCETCPFPP